MTTGMLWFDSDPKTALADKVRKAAAYYLKKYGRAADCCYVHRGALAEALRVDEIQVAPHGSVLPHHFWLGVSA